MTLSVAFQNARAGLTIASRRAEVVSSNVANALTPGYVRRELVVTAGAVGPNIDSVRRAGDAALTRERRLTEGAAAREQAIASAQRTLSAALGEPDDAFSLSGAYQALETALRTLSEEPESAPAQSAVLEQARALASAFNLLANQVRDVRETADAAIATDVAFVNNALQQIDEINSALALNGNGGQDFSSLLDQRQQLINEISEIIPVREIPRSNGAIDLITQEGVFLIAGTPREIQFLPTGTISPDLSFNGGAGQLSGISVDGVDITPDGARPNLAIQSGRLAGNFAVRDEVTPNFTQQLDALARDLVERFESGDTTRAPGAAGLFTDAGGPFNPAAETGLAGRLAINAAVDPSAGGALFRIRDGVGAASEGPAGDATIVQSVLDAFRSKRAPPPGAQLSGLKSAAEAAAGVASIVGAVRLTAESRLASSNARAEAIREAEQTVLGVDIDTELQQLIAIEQAYAANARVLEVAQSLVETLTRIGS